MSRQNTAAANGARGDRSPISSGIAPLDELLGGILPGRLHLLTGGPGTGKTTAGLQFLNDGLQKGEAVALLTADRVSDLDSHTRSIGLDLEASLSTCRLIVIRFRTDFTSMLESTLPNELVSDVGKLFGNVQPVRLVIDPITPFLTSRSAAGSALSVFVRLLEELSITTICTYPADVSDGYDLRLDPVVQRAAAIVHVAHGDNGKNTMRVIQSRARPAPVTPVEFVAHPQLIKPKRTRNRVPREKSST